MSFKKKNKSDNDSNVKTKKKGKKVIEHELSDIAKELGLRISTPYGYFPEDADKHLVSMKEQIRQLSLETKKLAEENDRLKKEVEAAQGQIGQLQLDLYKMQEQFSSAEFAAVSPLTAGNAINKMSAITGSKPDSPDAVLMATSAYELEEEPIDFDFFEQQQNQEQTQQEQQVQQSAQPENTTPQIKFNITI